MKILSLDSFYKKIKRTVLLVEGYTEIKNLAFILTACRLKPIGLGSKLELHRHWVDEFGSSLKIIKKKIQIVHNDLSIDREHLPCTDLYYGLSLERIVKMSKLSYLCYGQDEDEIYYIISFLGIDNYLRTYLRR